MREEAQRQRDDIQQDEAQQARKRGISGSTLKLIAVGTMLVDHIAAVVLLRILLADGYVSLVQEAGLSWTYQVMRNIGRLGFPLFCFLLIEGFQHTRNVGKYMLRLGLFGLISELPFDLATSGGISWKYQNVYFTLFLGMFVLCAFRYFRTTALSRAAGNLFLAAGLLAPAVYYGMYTRFTFTGTSGDRLWMLLGVLGATAAVYLWYGSRYGMARLRILGQDIAVLMFVMYLAEFMGTDYAGMGVLTIAVMYAFRKNKVLSMAAGCAVLTVMALNELPAFLALLPVACYNGRRGWRLKYLFYVFYPLHLLLLYLIAVWLGYGTVAL